ncbi:MAG: cyanophycin synthetase, partial [Clostridium butyricum]|nr:cyanophycin synthetase [Clostridium butyricum]
MKIVKKRIYEGKNIYSHKKCIRIDVDLEGYSEIPSKKIPNFNFNIVEILPELKKHRCGIDEEGGFVKRLEEGTYLAHICEHCIIAIQNLLGMDVSYGKAREIKGELYYIIVQYEYENTAIEIINLAVDLINSLIKSSPINFNGRLQEIKQTLQR